MTLWSFFTRTWTMFKWPASHLIFTHSYSRGFILVVISDNYLITSCSQWTHTINYNNKCHTFRHSFFSSPFSMRTAERVSRKTLRSFFSRIFLLLDLSQRERLSFMIKLTMIYPLCLGCEVRFVVLTNPSEKLVLFEKNIFDPNPKLLKTWKTSSQSQRCLKSQ